MSDDTDAKNSALITFRDIADKVNALKRAEKSGSEDEFQDASDRITESALTVEVRTGWYSPGDPEADRAAMEYRILLSTGGPAIQIAGTLSEHGEPITARLQYQDWFKPWTDWNSKSPDTVESILLTFVRCFYFGEG